MIKTICFAVILLIAEVMQGQTRDSASCCCTQTNFAPAGIMTDHVHEKGKFGIAYAYMDMQMRGNASGSSMLSDEQVYAHNYMMAPGRMNMQMHMLMLMYGITDRFTVMAMPSFIQNNMSMHMMPMQMMNMPGMTMERYNGMPASSAASGLGDTRLYALYNFLSGCKRRLVAGIGLSFPTGNISAKGATVQSANDVLPYNMQLGTGTFDVLPSLVYAANLTDKLSLGLSANANIKNGVNSHTYAFGNEYAFSSWVSYKSVKWMSVSLRAEGYLQERIYGYDAQVQLSSLNDPSANKYNYGGRRVNAYAGLSFRLPLAGTTESLLMLEYGRTAWQNVNGVQMPLKSVISARVQFNF